MSQTTVKTYGSAIESQLFAQFQPDPANFSGLTFATKAGVFISNGAVNEVEADTVTLTDDSDNYVYLNTSNNVVSSTSSPVSGVRAMLYLVTTSSGAITNIQDLRGALL